MVWLGYIQMSTEGTHVNLEIVYHEAEQGRKEAEVREVEASFIKHTFNRKQYR